MSEHNYDTLILGGGGVKSVAMIGVLKIMDDKGILGKIHNYIGSSAGGLIAFLLSIGFSPTELHDIMMNIDFGKYRKINIVGLLNNCGLDDGKEFMRLIANIAKQKKITDTITFTELHEKFGNRLILTGSNISTEQSEFYDHISSPDMRVLDAVRITIAYPVIYTPVQRGDERLIDGGFFEPFPFNYLKDTKRIGIIFHNPKQRHDIKNFEDMLFGLFQGFVNRYEREHFKGSEDNIVFLPIEEVHAMKFDLSVEEKQKLYKIGLDEGSRFFNDA